MAYFPKWTLKKRGVIAPDERLPASETIIVGIQHVVAMFGATVLVPILIGFNPNTVIFFSGIATLLFFVIVGGRVPSYLGSSFAFIGVTVAATGYAGAGPNPNIGLALGGIIAAGALYAAIGVVVMVAGYKWIEKLMPPVVTGAIIAVIGLSLAPIAVKEMGTAHFDVFIALLTIAVVAYTAIYTRGRMQRLPILVGLGVSYAVYLYLSGAAGMGKPIDFTALKAAAWFGWPEFSAPVFDKSVMLLMAPVAIILVAENLGHIKAIGTMTGKNLDGYLGRAFLGDGVATMVAGFGGGTGVTTYAENMGVMAVTKVYSTLIFIVAGVLAIMLGLSPKFGALIQTIPAPVLGGLAVVVFGLITATAGRIWVENKVDFSDSRNLLTVGVALVIGAGNLTINYGNFTLAGITIATFGAMLMHYLLGFRKETD